MPDQDFNFPPAERREPKQFEPPPWERDAFEERARTKEPEEPKQPALEAPDAPAATEAPSSGQATTGEDEVPAGADAPAPDQAQVAEMMAGLRSEEPTPQQTYGVIAIALSIFTGLVGVVMLIWAMAMFVSATARGTGRIGVISGTIVAIFGALFIGLSLWVTVRTLRQRGVL